MHSGKSFLLCQQHFSHTPEQFQSNDANPVGKQAQNPRLAALQQPSGETGPKPASDGAPATQWGNRPKTRVWRRSDTAMPALHTLHTCTPAENRCRKPVRSGRSRAELSGAGRAGGTAIRASHLDSSYTLYSIHYIHYIQYFFRKGMQSVQSMQKHKRAPQNHGFTAQVRLPGLHTLHTRHPESGTSIERQKAPPNVTCCTSHEHSTPSLKCPPVEHFMSIMSIRAFHPSSERGLFDTFRDHLESFRVI